MGARCSSTQADAEQRRRSDGPEVRATPDVLLAAEKRRSDGPEAAPTRLDPARFADTVQLGQCFWEGRAAKVSSCATALFTVALFTLLAHSPVLGSFYCPLSRCEASRAQRATREPPSRPNEVLAIVCLALDVGVILFHVTHAVHPKYIATRFRKRVMFTHIVSGCAQVVLGPLIWVLYKHCDYPALTEALVKVLVIWCAAVHVTSAMFLARTPFGTVRAMLPAFIVVIGMYCYTLGELWSSAYADLEGPLLMWWLVLHIYVMNRVVFTLLAHFNLLTNARYTVSILLGTAICAPPALGETMMLFVVGAILVFNATFVLVRSEDDELETGRPVSVGGAAVITKLSDHFIAPEGAVYAPRLKELNAEHLTRREVAAVVFRQLDGDDSGKISVAEIANLCIAWGLPSWAAREMLRERDTNGDGEIDEQEFFDNFCEVWQFAATVVLGNVGGVNDGIRAGTLLNVSTGGGNWGHARKRAQSAARLTHAGQP